MRRHLLPILLLTMALGLSSPPARAANGDQESAQVKAAIAAFQEDRLDEARKLFQQVQKKTPNNPLAAYYLGQIFLQEDNLLETIRQWQRYIRLDPQGAEGNDVPRRLTLIRQEFNKKETDRLLANEAQFSSLPPEPNTIAVFPFTNTGDPRHDILAKGMVALIISDLSKAPGVRVLERQKIQRLLDEIRLNQSGLVAQEAQVKAGKLLRAEKLVKGEYYIGP